MQIHTQTHTFFAVLFSLTSAEKKPKPDVEHLFTDVYDNSELPWHLAEQKQQLDEHMAKYPKHYVHAEH
jgi:2-oxoisovalerate dehydrogenase E1 component alpha subunit